MVLAGTVTVDSGRLLVTGIESVLKSVLFRKLLYFAYERDFYVHEKF